MNTITELIDFLTNKMSMSEIYQPLIIKELVRAGGQLTKKELASKLALYDNSVQEYYEKILMRWPKITLQKHGIVKYNKALKTFELSLLLDNCKETQEILNICDIKINEWLEAKNFEKDPTVNASIRYEVLKAANGKCALCGISSRLRPLDVDHIVPKSKANKYGKVVKDNVAIYQHSPENLQALCFKCNRAKRDNDNTDFRKQHKLVRDNVIKEIEDSGRNPKFKTLGAKEFNEALEEKLIEEVSEYLNSKKTEELADIIEVVLAIASSKNISPDTLYEIQRQKKLAKGGFQKHHFYMGIKPTTVYPTSK